MRIEPRTSINLVAEDDKDRATLQALSDRCGEARVEQGKSIFREHELVIFLPVKQHFEYIGPESGRLVPPERPFFNIPNHQGVSKPSRCVLLSPKIDENYQVLLDEEEQSDD